MDRCLSPEDLAEVATLPEDHPRQRHLTRCARCRTLARRFRDFLDPAPLPPEADAEAASCMLRQRLAGALPPLAPALEGEGSTAAAAEPPVRGARRLPVGRSLLALAAVLVACIGLMTARNQLTQPDTTPSMERRQLRGDELRPQVLELSAAAGGLDLAWSQPAGTDASQAVFLDASLGEIARRPVGISGDHRIASLPAGARYLRVEFLQRGDVVATTRTLPIPASR